VEEKGAQAREFRWCELPAATPERRGDATETGEGERKLGEQ
jgi:hypothetical protein